MNPRIRTNFCFIVMILLGSSCLNTAQAQCGMGIPSAGNPNCIPPSVQGSPYGNSQGSYGQQPARQPIVIRHKWADRWGAISADGEAGSLGFVTGYPDKASAELAAVRECLRGGGRDCRKDYSFRNGCAALAINDNGAVMASAENEGRASDVALKRCESTHGVCRIYKTACSQAEAVPIR